MPHLLHRPADRLARYRERHSQSGAKSDVADAKLLAEAVRNDRRNHRLIAGDSPLASGIKVLARTHQNLIWERRRHANRLRSYLREFYPAAVHTLSDLTHKDALAVLAAAPTPSQGARLSISQIQAALKRGGRQRYLDRRSGEIQQGLQNPQLAAPTELEAAYAVTVQATVAVLVELNRQISQLEASIHNHFDQHPDAKIYLSMPGLHYVLGARVLGEFGDDPDRYPHPKSRKNYAATAPVTIASGKHHGVYARWIRNDRLYDAINRWAFSSISASPGCRAYYDQRIDQGDSHHKALRALGNRLVGILHGCLRYHTLYDEHTAWGHRQPTTNTLAA